jgi:hypothetical protein
MRTFEEPADLGLLIGVLWRFVIVPFRELDHIQKIAIGSLK